MSIKNKICSSLPTLLATVAFTLSSIAAFDCNFVVFVVPPQTDHDEQAGIWNYQWYDRNAQKYTCRAYPTNYEYGMDITIDPYWKASRGFSCLTLIFGGLIVFTNLYLRIYRVWHSERSGNIELSSPSRRRRNSVFTTASGYHVKKQVGITLYILACICSIFTLLLFLRSNACRHNTIFNLTQDHQCRLGTGAKLTYASMALYFIAASCVMLLNEENRTEVEDDIDDANNNTEPLIQDIVFECEQSVYSNSSSNNREGRNDLAVSALTWEPAMGEDEESSDGE